MKRIIGYLDNLSWVKLNFFIPIGRSSKNHYIYRSKKWNKKYEKIFKKPVFNENYSKIGYIKDIFGPIDSPFISIKSFSKKELPDSKFNPDQKLYVKI
ncbi:MAG: hypothetical protein EU550_01410 [Promethearchaeota archaeon]|nr:MAG: hypothetical protein EU550_01410 [Candidatus Lokiarchaeota archaeon]